VYTSSDKSLCKDKVRSKEFNKGNGTNVSTNTPHYHVTTDLSEDKYPYERV